MTAVDARSDPQRAAGGRQRDGRRPAAHLLQHDDLRGARLLHRAARHQGRADLAERRRRLALRRRPRRAGRSTAWQRYGRDGFKPGDVIITNHQAVAGQHLNNVVIYMPYFYKGELLMFPMVRAHWIDVGGTSTGFGAGADRGRPLARRAAARPAQDLRGGRARRDALPRHQGQHPLSGILARRHEIADGGLPAGGAPARRAVRQIRPRHACSPRSHRSSTRPSRSAATSWRSSRTASTRHAPRSTTTACSRARRCRSTSR